MAIAFGHKSKGWRSRYSYTPKAMVGFNKELYSSDGAKVHKHNVGENNSFYGNVVNSGISVAFNDNLSANKIFKTVSIEGSDSLENDTAGSVFYPYKSTDKSTYYIPSSLEPMKIKGGILYGGLGRDRSLINGATMHYVGQVMRVGSLSSVMKFFPGIDIDAIPPEWVAFTVDTTGSDYVPEPGVRYGLYYGGQFYFGGGTSDVPAYKSFDDLESFDDIPNTLNLPQGLPLLSRSEPIKDPYVFAYPAIHPTQYLINNPINQEAMDEGVSLFAFKDPAVHGGDLRGQRAEMFLNLGSDDFELYSINLNYEPVSADHTK